MHVKYIRVHLYVPIVTLNLHIVSCLLFVFQYYLIRRPLPFYNHGIYVAQVIERLTRCIECSASTYKEIKGTTEQVLNNTT